MRMGYVSLTVLLGVACSACLQTAPTSLPRHATPTQITQQLVRLADVAEHGHNRSDRLAAAQQGQALAQSCVRQHPDVVACRYYRAVHTGLYHQLHPFGYQKGLTRMLADCEVVNARAPQLADAGCYRMIGQIFSQLPQTAFRPEHLVRDLDRAATALKTAVSLAPRSLENQLALCEVTLALGETAAARGPCTSAAALLPALAATPGYSTWKSALAQAERQLQR